MMMVLPLRGHPSGLGGSDPQGKAVRGYGGCAQPIEVVEDACHGKQHGECQSQGGLIPQWAEKQSQMLMIQPNQESVCLLSSIHCTAYIQIHIQISLNLKY